MRYPTLRETLEKFASEERAYFEPSGKFLFVGNQTTNQMVTFAVDPDIGKITPAGAKTEIPKPACVKFLME